MTAPPSDQAEAAFLRWFECSGGSLDARCRLRSIPGMGRGMVALHDIPASTTLFTIPRRLLLNLSTSALSSTLSSCGDTDVVARWRRVQHAGWVPLILTMLWERRRAALLPPSPAATADGDVSMDDLSSSSNPLHWGPYFDIMPSSFSTPMFWSDAQLELLRGTSICDKIARSDAEADYYTHLLPLVRSCPAVFGGGDEVERWYSLDLYHIMGSRILSRSFHVKSPKRGRDGEVVGMDVPDDDDEQEGEGEVLDEEHEGDQDVVPNPDDDDDQDANDDADETRETHSTASASEPDSDSDSDSEEEEEEEEEDESERICDISMVPMADMLNARFASDNARLFYKSSELCMRSTKPIAAGSQIFNTYADPPNSDLLRRYGHVDEPNGNDVVELPSSLVVDAAVSLLSSRLPSPSHADANLRQDLEERLGWACSSLGIDETYILGYLFPPSDDAPHRPSPQRPTPKQLKAAATGGGIDEELVALARILAMPRGAFERARSKGKGPSARIESVELHPPPPQQKGEVRIETAQIIYDALCLRLAQLPGGAEVAEEEDRLYPTSTVAHQGNHKLDEIQRRALVVRLGEKRVLLDQQRAVAYVLERVKAEAKGKETAAAANPKRKGQTEKGKGNKKAKR
ncbi:Ribosomal lysine N-methyltransferase 4 [Thecaphora frezii]